MPYRKRIMHLFPFIIKLYFLHLHQVSYMPNHALHRISVWQLYRLANLSKAFTVALCLGMAPIVDFTNVILNLSAMIKFPAFL